MKYKIGKEIENALALNEFNTRSDIAAVTRKVSDGLELLSQEAFKASLGAASSALFKARMKVLSVAIDIAPKTPEVETVDPEAPAAFFGRWDLDYPAPYDGTVDAIEALLRGPIWLTEEQWQAGDRYLEERYADIVSVLSQEVPVGVIYEIHPRRVVVTQEEKERRADERRRKQAFKTCPNTFRPISGLGCIAIE
jgi:hypothetical protein